MINKIGTTCGRGFDGHPRPVHFAGKVERGGFFVLQSNVTGLAEKGGISCKALLS